MPQDSSSIVPKFWNYAYVLKNAGGVYGGCAEQCQIVAEVEARTTAIDHLEAGLDRQISRANRLRQSTLAAAFSGNLVCHCHHDHRLDYHLQHQKAHA
jgi:hypothetical protein